MISSFILYLLVFISFLLIFYQDLRNREVDLFLFLVLIGASLTIKWGFILNNYWHLIFNTVFILINFAALFFYCRVRFPNKKLFKSLIGQGDILMWFSLVALFEFEKFILLFVLSLIFSFLCHYLLIQFRFYNNSTVPLAGFQSIFFSAVFVIETFIPAS
ncbi:Type IV leader peptidase family protein [Ekhidna lutea]|uniref:Type IV leader peptidase family protein n=1 Tax=Ekhidna lutea TaxID=447679 RepID=A0A239K7N8_EKHLU|nr:Type IV leader peptidase family protein [Ekhidna lutea]